MICSCCVSGVRRKPRVRQPVRRGPRARKPTARSSPPIQRPTRRCTAPSPPAVTVLCPRTRWGLFRPSARCPVARNLHPASGRGCRRCLTPAKRLASPRLRCDDSGWITSSPAWTLVRRLGGPGKRVTSTTARQGWQHGRGRNVIGETGQRRRQGPGYGDMAAFHRHKRILPKTLQDRARGQTKRAGGHC